MVDPGFEALEAQFEQEMFPIYPLGDIKVGANFFAWAVINDKVDVLGKTLDASEIILRYKEYFSNLQQYQNGKWTKKEHRILTPDNWLREKLYLRPLVKRKDPLDFYLFGDMLDE